MASPSWHTALTNLPKLWKVIFANIKRQISPIEWNSLWIQLNGIDRPGKIWCGYECLPKKYKWNAFYIPPVRISSVQFSRSVVSDSLQPHESQHTRPPCPHQLPEFTETHVHRVSDAIQPSHPLSSPSPPALNPSHHESLFQWVNSLHEVAKVLEFQL